MLQIKNYLQSLSPDLFGGSIDGMDYPHKAGNDVAVGFSVCEGSVG